MPDGTHPSLKLLSRKVKKTDIEAFIRIADHFADTGDQLRADAVLEVSTTANEMTYNELYEEEGTNMSEALMRIMKKDIDMMVAEGHAEGRAEGRAEGANLLGALISKLIKLGRNQDIERAATDSEYCQQLYRELDIA